MSIQCASLSTVVTKSYIINFFKMTRSSLSKAIISVSLNISAIILRPLVLGTVHIEPL